MCVEKNRVHKCSLQNRHAHLQGIITSVHKAGSPGDNAWSGCGPWVVLEG